VGLPMLNSRNKTRHRSFAGFLDKNGSLAVRAVIGRTDHVAARTNQLGASRTIICESDLDPKRFSRQELLLLRRKLECNPGFLSQRRTSEKKQKSEAESYFLHLDLGGSFLIQHLVRIMPSIFWAF